MPCATPVFAVYFHKFEDTRAAWRSAGFAWVPLLHGGVSNGVYYRWCLGLDTPQFHVLAMLKHFAVIVLVIVWFAFLFRRNMDSAFNRLLAIAGVAVVLAAASCFDWTDCGRALPLLDLLFCVLLCANYSSLAHEKAGGLPCFSGAFSGFSCNWPSSACSAASGITDSSSRCPLFCHGYLPVALAAAKNARQVWCPSRSFPHRCRTGAPARLRAAFCPIANRLSPKNHRGRRRAAIRFSRSIPAQSRRRFVPDCAAMAGKKSAAGRHAGRVA